jgi:hypothetical protein
MRVALLASTFVLLAGSPAFAQCVYVACNGGQAPQPTYQQPAYQAPTPAPRPPQNNAQSDYDAGYRAGLAARPATRAVSRSGHRPAVRSTGTRKAAVTRGSGTRHVGAGTTGRRVVTTAPRQHVARPAVRTVTRHVSRPAVRQVARTAPRTNVRTNYATTYRATGYSDPIKNRASTYGASTYGSATSMASLMSRSGGASTISWVGPSAVSSQNGQTCGWGARIVTNAHGHGQRQAVWVCQCPQGWRPPGY